MGFVQYLKDTKGELRHVAWPTRTQTTVFTAFVALLSIAVALYLGFFDFVITQGLERVLERVAPQEIPAGLEISTTTAPAADTATEPVTE